METWRSFLPWGAAGLLGVTAALLWAAARRADLRTRAIHALVVPLRTGLDKALERIANFSDSQSRFLGNLAEELEAPLATVLIHADLLAGGTDTATVRRYSVSIAEDVRHLSDLVGSFLRLARPFATEDTTNHVPVHFHDLVLEAVRRCQSLAAARVVSVVPMLPTLESEAPVEVLGDAVLLEAMIENLVRNAVLSAPRGTRVDLLVRVTGEQVRLSVRDHGENVDAERQESVFDGFFRLTPPPRATASTGLGLAIAKRVAEHHRGTISLRNVADGGCEFEIQLPRWRPEGPLSRTTRTGARP